MDRQKMRWRLSLMKLKCNCGRTISDGTDALPYKAQILADEDLFPTFDRLDQLLDRVAKRGRVTEGDYMDVRRSHPPTRHIYQCRDCGRVLVWDRTIKGAFSFKPEDTDVTKNLMEGRRKPI